MEPEQLNWLAALLNRLLGRPVGELLRLLHVPGVNPEHPISNALATELLAFVIGVVFFLWLKKQLSVDRPGAVQQCVEGLLTNGWGLGVRDMLEDFIGHEGLQFMPVVGSIGIFVLIGNSLGMIPTLRAPTATNYVPLGCAVVVFLYYHTRGLRKHGPTGYLRTFMGPGGFTGAFMLLPELLSNVARLLSLTVRLWANMMAGEMAYQIFLGLAVALMLFLGRLNPLGYLSVVVADVIPVGLLLLHIFEALLQAFVFTILPVIYLQMAVGEEH